MNIAQYLTESARTVAPSSDPDLIVHAALGICTELEELLNSTTTTNVVEEAGDTMWYVAILFRAQGVTAWEQLKTNSNYTIAAQLTPFGAAAAIADAAKRHKFYGTPMPWATVNFALNNVRNILNTYCAQARITLDVAMEANIEKLRTRYPAKFTQESAEKRDLLSEEKALAASILAGHTPSEPPAEAVRVATAPAAPPQAPPATRPKLTRIVGDGGRIVAGPAQVPPPAAGPTTRQH